MNDHKDSLKFVDYIQNNAIALNNLTNLPEKILQILSNFKIIILGEIHGINETPEMILGIIKLLSRENKPIILAIEVWDSQQITFDKFMQTGNIEFLKNSSFFENIPQYGVGSLALINLLQDVIKVPNVKVFCFDPYSSDIKITNQNDRITLSQKRDLQMARNLNTKIKENENATLVVLTGSLHASTEKLSLLGADYKPMAYLLSHGDNSSILQTDILSVLLKFEQGKFWGGLSEDGVEISYGVHEVTPSIDAYNQAVELDKYFLLLDQKQEGFDAILFNRVITPSLPLIKH